MGHVLNNTLQDVLVALAAHGGRRRRSGCPGTDHAGIATQNVVEKQLREGGQDPPRPRARGVRRAGLGVEGAVRRHDPRSSCSASAPRATGSASASRWTRRSRARCARCSSRLYEKGLIYRGNCIVNWCPRCQTALSDEEVGARARRDGQLWHIRYPVEDGEPGIDRSRPRAPRRCSATPAWRCIPKDERYRAADRQDARCCRSLRPRRSRSSPTTRSTGVRHRRGEGDAGARPERLRDRPAPRPAAARRSWTSDGDDERRTAAPSAGLDRFEARKRIVADARRRRACSRRPSRTACRSAAATAATRWSSRYLSLQWFVKMQPLAEPAIAAVAKRPAAVHPRALDEASTCTGWRTSATGASRASSGGATASRSGTATTAAR